MIFVQTQRSYFCELPLKLEDSHVGAQFATQPFWRCWIITWHADNDKMPLVCFTVIYGMGLVI